MKYNKKKMIRHPSFTKGTLFHETLNNKKIKVRNFKYLEDGLEFV